MRTRIIHQALKSLEMQLVEKELDAHAAFLLLEHVTGKSRASLLADFREPMTAEQTEQFERLSGELLTGKPIQHIIGEEWFFGRPFTVSPDVLIPRPETEELLMESLRRAADLFGEKVIQAADIGTGSGAIAITFQLEYRTVEMTATDISEAALSVARENAQRNNAVIDFRKGDLTEPLQNERWDVILCNPPYIAQSETSLMSPTVLNYEPHKALFAEEEGLALYRKLAETLPSIVNEKALIGLEIGHLQGEAVQNLFRKSFPEATIDLLQDINGKDRMIFCEIQ